MYKIENAQLIEKLNMALGTKHRSKPYDLTNPSDLKHALEYAVGAYRDYRHYAAELDNLFESYDESLEHYDPASWFYMGRSSEKTDALSAECAGALNHALQMFEMMTERAKDNCALILKIALTSPPDTQEIVLGRAYNIEVHELDKMIEELFFTLVEVEYDVAIPVNFANFIELMQEMWASKT